MSSDMKLPDSFDVIVCGTGLPESMIAACLSRVGKKVLHIDRNDYYGGQWATFTFEALNKWIQKYEKQSDSQKVEILNVVPRSDVCVRNVVIRSYIPDKCTNTEDIEVLNGHVSNEQDSNKNTGEDRIDCNIDVKDCNNENSMDLNDKDIDIRENEPDIEDGTDNKGKIKDISEQDSNKNTGEDKIDCNIDVKNCNNEDSMDLNNKDIDIRENEPDIEDGTDNKGKEKDFSVQNNSLSMNGTINADQSIIGKSKVPQTMISQARIRQNSDDISLEDFILLSRKFNLDITTKFLFSAGPLVNAIIKANISHYAEFKVVNRILTWKDEQIMEVPCNRADVFASTFLTMIEKRVLMKFLTSCIESPEESEEMTAFNGRPFKEFLESRRLSESLQKFIIYSIALVKPDTPTEFALSETTKFLKSLGRYGKSPFIWPLYGMRELPEAFCRMSAVFGGTYCLNINIETIEFGENDKIKACIDGQKIECDHIVMDNSYVPCRFEAQISGKMISRAILITNQSLLPTAEEHLSFLTIPPLLGHEESVRVIEIGPASSACPSGLFVLYLTSVSSSSTAEEDLLQYTTLLTTNNGGGSNKPKLLWSVYFNQIEDIIFEGVSENVYIPSLPGSSLGFELAVEEAKNIFHSICPDEEFMLAVPNSEDIIWGGDGDEKTDKMENKDGENSNSNDTVDVLNLEKTTGENSSLQDGVDDNISDKVTCNSEKNSVNSDNLNVNDHNCENYLNTIDNGISSVNGADGNLSDATSLPTKTFDKEFEDNQLTADKTEINSQL